MTSLEFNRVLEEVASHASSDLGKKELAKLRPSSDPVIIKRRQEETEDALKLILQFKSPPLFSITDLKAELQRADKGGILTMGQLLKVADGLRQAQALKEYGEKADQDLEDVEKNRVLAGINLLFAQEGLRGEIDRSILDPSTMSDQASPSLRRIRKSLRSRQGQVKDRLKEIMVKEAQADRLTDSIITVRGGRYVLPVKAEKQNFVKGLVHDQSGSGQTVFIEPLAIVELNNDIRQLELEEDKEVQRILALLTDEVAEYGEELALNQELLTWLDFTFAKADYALATGCHRPVFSQDRSLNLKNARHPLLGEDVVPIDISLGEDFNSLIITGPNTGGKTVTLKTLGLLQVMGQSGLQIPCDSGSKLAIFSSIYADIGDRQSIELSLSTFSASMSNIVDIIDQADKGSLLLFDELGAGTDPTEGAALAMAILQYALERDIRTVATTHYSELKLYAVREEGVQNASVKFDVETLSPTFKLEIGLPGRSNAFEISQRLGLQEEVLNQAKLYLDAGNINFESALAEIEEDQAQIARERSKIEGERKRYMDRLERMQKELDQAKSAYDREMKEARSEAEEIVRKAKQEAQAMIREAKQAGQGNRQDLDRGLTAINDRAKSFEADQLKTKEKKKTPDREGPKNVKPGDRVQIISLQETGNVIEGPDKDGDVVVQMGLLKVNSNLKDLALAPEEEKEEEEERDDSPKAVIHSRKAMNISPHIDIRGQRYVDAMDTVDRYLDDAVLAGLKQVRIIHGKGTGALRKGVSDLLKGDRRVKSYRQAPVDQGGAGAMDVKLK